MNVTQIEENVRKTVADYDKESFIFSLLLAYGMPKASVKRLQSGDYNLSGEENAILWKKKLCFTIAKKSELYSTIDRLKNSDRVQKQQARFVIVTDHKTILAIDTKTNDSLDISLSDLPKRFDFFLPWAGFERTVKHTENAADVKAAEKMAKLYDQLVSENSIGDVTSLHALNVFLSRLLFCYFAEDTEIFSEGIFTGTISFLTSDDGSDLGKYFEKLFVILNTQKRTDVAGYLSNFPYVNGGLFAQKLPCPTFSKKSRKLILECGELDWSEINPDIFGSMMQAVVNTEQRATMGMHYTSVVNILKVIQPLFIDDLQGELEAATGNIKKLKALHLRISKVNVFDPACGSGNFLIISYKELRKLEMLIFKKIQEVSKQAEFPMTELKLSQFFGIDIDDFACEVARLSLWLAEHQMNLVFSKLFGRVESSLPLKESGTIIAANALRKPWSEVCPNDEDREIYVLGNPPYVGARNQTEDQKSDLCYALKDLDGANSLDFIAGWFYLAAKFVNSPKIKYAFVSTNSISQGEQVALLWPSILNELKLEIRFAHQSFRWANMAKNKAVVTCVIIGVQQRGSSSAKYIFNGTTSKKVKNISPYLTENENVFVHKRSDPLLDVDKLVFGNQVIDGGNLFLTDGEKADLLIASPEAQEFVRPIYGAEDFIDGKNRWCLWVTADNLDRASNIPLIAQRFARVRAYRESGGEVARSLVDIPYRFRYIHEAKSNLLVLPRTTSEFRDYIPIGFLDAKCVVTDAAQVIYDPRLYTFGFLSSRIHLIWVKAVAGRLKTDIRYSNQICYNNFPFPELSASAIAKVEKACRTVLSEREHHPDKTLSQLYDKDTMPPQLAQAHKVLDLAVETCFRSKPFTSDDERLSFLFDRYTKLIESANA